MQIALDIDSNFFPELPTLTANCQDIILPMGVQHQTYLLRSPSLCVTLLKGLTLGCHAAISFSFTAYILSQNTLNLTYLYNVSLSIPLPKSSLSPLNHSFPTVLPASEHYPPHYHKAQLPHNLDMICVSLL